MLVLTRRVGEEIIIGNDISLKVVAVSGHHIRLGITAPHTVSVARAELLDGHSETPKIAKASEPQETQLNGEHPVK
jgi:carbon storage regulator